KSFEMNKAFNDQLHRAQTPKKPEEAPVEKVEKKEEVKPVEKTELPETQERQSEGEKKDNTLEPAEKKEPEKKFTDLTEEDITRELNRVLIAPKEEEKHSEEVKKE